MTDEEYVIAEKRRLAFVVSYYGMHVKNGASQYDKFYVIDPDDLASFLKGYHEALVGLSAVERRE